MLLANNTASFSFHHIPPPPSSTSPTPSHYSTPPTSRKRFCFGGNNDNNVGNGAAAIDEFCAESPRSPSGLFTLPNNEREVHSPPPLSSFYDTPVDGSLTVAEEPETSNLFSDYRRDAGLTMSRKKRGFSETLEDNEYYENGRTGPGGVGTVRKDGKNENAGKRRIIEMVGSVASKVWEICKVGTSGILSFPGALLGAAAAGDVHSEMKEAKGIDGLFLESEDGHGIDGIYENPTTPLAEEAGYYDYSYSSLQHSRGTNSLDLPNHIGDHHHYHSETNRRTSSSSRSSQGCSSCSSSRSSLDEGNNVNSNSNSNSNSDNIQAQWVFVQSHDSSHYSPCRTVRPSSSRSNITRRSTGKPVGHIRTGSGTVSASPSSYCTAKSKRRPFRFPVKPISTTANVMFGFSSGNNVNSSCVVAAAHTMTPRKLRRVHRRASNFGIEEDSRSPGDGDDEVDESIRRFNEQLKAMIREGKEALGSKVEVVYDGDPVEIF